ncbi:hypothetical protein [Solimonas soli]|uniref:hypothetical protein n=1 Tax=Solimonas soli TaxID=413479 RepID=UPI003F4F9C2D
MTPCRALAGGMAPDCGNPQLFIEKKLPIVKREGRRRSRIATALENARGGRNLYAAYMRSVSPGPRIPTAGGVPICPPQQAASREARYMGDLLYLGLGVAGFALMLLYVRACQKL